MMALLASQRRHGIVSLDRKSAGCTTAGCIRALISSLLEE
jgi:hypothetical protein